MSKVDTSYAVSKIIDTLSTKTINSIEADLYKIKEQFVEKGEEAKFYYIINCLLQNPDTALDDNELYSKLKDLVLTKQTLNQQVTILTNALSLLMVRCNVNFHTEEDTLTAFFNILPEYFRTDYFFNEVNQDTVLIPQDTIYSIQVKSYVVDTDFFHRQQQWFKQFEPALDFFLGTQLLADIFN